MRKCQGCQKEIDSKFCPHCGEKKFIKSDLSVKSLLKEFVDTIINLNFDTKFLRSYRALIFPPGELTKLYCNGVRSTLYSPLKVFLFTNIIFYILLNNTTMFYSTISSLIEGYDNFLIGKNIFQSNTYVILSEKAKLSGVDVEPLQKAINEIASDLSRTWLFLIAPIFSVPIFLLNTKELYAKSYIISINFISGFMLLSIVLFGPFIWFNKSVSEAVLVLFYATTIIFFVFSLKNSTNYSTIKAMIFGVILIALFYFILALYKQVVTIIAIRIWPSKGIFDYLIH